MAKKKDDENKKMEASGDKDEKDSKEIIAEVSNVKEKAGSITKVKLGEKSTCFIDCGIRLTGPNDIATIKGKVPEKVRMRIQKKGLEIVN